MIDLIQPKRLEVLARSIAALEIMLMPRWEYRYYTYSKEVNAMPANFFMIDELQSIGYPIMS